jgi:hypothetical protein
MIRDLPERRVRNQLGLFNDSIAEKKPHESIGKAGGRESLCEGSIPSMLICSKWNINQTKLDKKWHRGIYHKIRQVNLHLNEQRMRLW